MKRVLCVLFAIAFVGCVGACGRGETEIEPETTAAETTTTEQATSKATMEELTTQRMTMTDAPGPAKMIVAHPGYEATAAYAKTPTHFYAMNWDCTLFRAPLNDLGQKEEIKLPSEYEGEEYKRGKICGISPEGVYVHLCLDYPGSDKHYGAVYLVPHDGQKVITIVDEGRISSAWYNAGSNSMLLYDHEKATLEALQLDTNKRVVIEEGYDNLPVDFGSDVWHNFEDGSVMLMGMDSYRLFGLQIDAKNNMRKKNNMAWNDFYYPWHKRPANEGEKALAKKNENTIIHVTTYATHNGWLYYVEDDDFYRMDLDGSKKKLLRAKTHIRELVSMHDKLFALAGYHVGEDSEAGYTDISLHILDVHGKVLETVARTREGPINSGVGLRKFGNMLLISDLVQGGGFGERFLLLYDPATGATFTAEA